MNEVAQRGYVKRLTQEAADKEFRVDLGFQGLFGTKHLYPDGVYGSAPWLLPSPKKKEEKKGGIVGADGKKERQ